MFVLLEGSPAACVGSMRVLDGTIYQTSLDPDLEQQVADSLEQQD